MSRPARDMKERFEEKYILEPGTGCWLWVASRRTGGYGQFAKNAKKGPSRKIEHAHRVSWELYCGEIPKGLHVLHKCDVRRCVNPDHLFLGTRSDNMTDASRKGRLGKKTKVSVEMAKEIRASKHGPNHLARKYGVSPTHVCAIRKGRRHKLNGGESVRL